MDFQIIKDILALLEEFNSKNINSFYPSTIEGFNLGFPISNL